MTMYPYNEPTSQQPQYYGPQSYAVPQQQQPIQPSYNPQYTLASQQAYPSQPPPQQQYAAPQPQLVVATTAYVPAVVAPSSTVVVTNTSTRKPKSEDTQAALTIFLVGLLLFFVSGAIPGIICWVIGGCFIISKGNASSRTLAIFMIVCGLAATILVVLPVIAVVIWAIVVHSAVKSGGSGYDTNY